MKKKRKLTEGEQAIADALSAFGWTCGDEFWVRYYTDPWVFSLANAVESLYNGPRS